MAFESPRAQSHTRWHDKEQTAVLPDSHRASRRDQDAGMSLHKLGCSSKRRWGDTWSTPLLPLHKAHPGWGGWHEAALARTGVGLTMAARTEHGTLRRHTAHGTGHRQRPTYLTGLGTACSQGKAGGWSACSTPSRTQRRCARVRQSLRYHSVCRGGEEHGQRAPTATRPPRCRGDAGREALSTWMGLAPLAGGSATSVSPSHPTLHCPAASMDSQGWGAPNPVRTEEGSDPKEFENFPVRKKAWMGPAPPCSSSPQHPSLCHPPHWERHPWRHPGDLLASVTCGGGRESRSRGELAVGTLPDGSLV